MILFSTPLFSFHSMTEDEILNTICSMSNRICELVSLSAFLYSDYLPLHPSFITDITFLFSPSTTSSAFIHLLLKKIFPRCTQNYCPAFSLSVLSELISSLTTYSIYFSLSLLKILHLTELGSLSPYSLSWMLRLLLTPLTIPSFSSDLIICLASLTGLFLLVLLYLSSRLQSVLISLT